MQSRPSADAHAIWRLSKDGATAEARVEPTEHGQRLQLKVEDEVVFSCLFCAGDGEQQLTALANTAQAELRERGWSE